MHQNTPFSTENSKIVLPLGASALDPSLVAGIGDDADIFLEIYDLKHDLLHLSRNVPVLMSPYHQQQR